MISAQSDDHMGHIGLEDGLTSQLCLHIVEDGLGNLWISTFKDLHKYDGYSVTKIDFGKERNNIGKLWKDGLGNIWTIQGELDTKENSFYWNVYFPKVKIYIVMPLSGEIISFQDYIESEEIKVEDIVKIFIHKDKIFLCTKDNLIFSFTNKLEFHTKVEDLHNVIAINKNSDIVIVENRSLITKSAAGKVLHQIDSLELQEYEFLVPSNSAEVFLINEIGNNVIVDEYNQNKISHLDTFTKKEIKFNSNVFNRIKKFNGNQLLINGILFRKNRKYKEVFFKRARYINEYFISKTGLGYAVTNLGVYIINNKKQLFQKLAFDEARKNSVRGIFMNNNLMLHKVYDHEIILDKSTRKEFDFLKNMDLGYMSYGHYLDPKNEDHLWSFGLIPEGIRKIDFENKKLAYIGFHKPNNTNTMLRSASSSKLYTTSSNGIFVIDEEENTQHKLEINIPIEQGFFANHVIERKNELWFATSQGVLQYNEFRNEFRMHKIFKENEEHTFQFLHVDKIDPGTFWLGTRQGGLVKWILETDSIQVFNSSNGLSNNDVHSIIEDNSNRLWISTNRYLNCLDKANNKISIFTEHDGLSDSEFNKHGFFHDKENNEIYFGGLNGYNFFNPDSILISDRASKINVRIINAIKTNSDGETENIYNNLIESNEIEFIEKDLSLELGLSTNYLFDSDEVEFSYRIPKLSKEWKSQKSNTLKLNRLPYGRFEIELISDLNKPSFTSNILTLQINVIKPFWKTWLFFILATLTLLLFVWWGFKKYFQILNDRNIRLEKEVIARTEELTESNNTKNKLFAILAHDLRNPISSLSNLSEKIKFLKTNNRLDELDEMAKHTDSKLNALNDNLNNILLWAAKESNLVGNEVVKVLIKNELNQINELYKDSIKQKNLVIINNIPDTSFVYIDIRVFQTIVRNLIKNAIKFSYQGGEIEYSLTEKNGLKELKVIDKGIGLESKESKSESLKNTLIRKKGKGTGIGLKLSEELAVKSNLKLSLIPNPDGGAIGLIQFSKQHNNSKY